MRNKINEKMFMNTGLKVVSNILKNSSRAEMINMAMLVMSKLEEEDRVIVEELIDELSNRNKKNIV